MFYARSVEIQLLMQISECATKVQLRKLNGFTKVVLNSKYSALATALLTNLHPSVSPGALVIFACLNPGGG
jgi:hypothetical protein